MIRFPMFREKPRDFKGSIPFFRQQAKWAADVARQSSSKVRVSIQKMKVPIPCWGNHDLSIGELKRKWNGLVGHVLNWSFLNGFAVRKAT